MTVPPEQSGGQNSAYRSGCHISFIFINLLTRAALSVHNFWNSKEDAEQYHCEQYPRVRETLEHLVEVEPVIRTFDVHSSTSLRIAAGKAA